MSDPEKDGRSEMARALKEVLVGAIALEQAALEPLRQRHDVGMKKWYAECAELDGHKDIEGGGNG